MLSSMDTYNTTFTRDIIDMKTTAYLKRYTKLHVNKINLAREEG